MLNSASSPLAAAVMSRFMVFARLRSRRWPIRREYTP
jgi:hypothetical protein